MTSPFRLDKWVQESIPETKCICCKIEYYEFKYSCTRLSQGFTHEKTLVIGLIEIGALQGGKTLLRQKRDYCHYGGPARDYSIVDAKTLMMEQKREAFQMQESSSSDEPPSSDFVTESSSEASTSHKKSEIRDNTRAKQLQEIYNELAESVAEFEKSPNKNFEETVPVLDDKDSDTASVNTEGIIEELYEYFDKEIYFIDNSSQMDLSHLNGYDGDYSEFMSYNMPSISSDDVSDELASIETPIVDSNTLKRDLEVSSTPTESYSCKKVKLETEKEFPQPGTSSNYGNGIYEN